MTTVDDMNCKRISWCSWTLAAGIILCALSLVAVNNPEAKAEAAQNQWVPTWSAAPEYIDTAISNQTIRMMVRSTLGGKQVRIRVSNAFGNNPLVVGAAHIGLRQQGAAIVPGTDRRLTFGGQPTITIPPGAYALCDPAPLDVPQLADLAVTLYMPGTFAGETAHRTSLKTTYLSTPGDFSNAAEITATKTTLSYYWLTDVYVEAADHPAVIFAIGDSITDGVHTTPNTNSSWPSVLGELLLDKPGHTRAAVLNEGIGGNQLYRHTSSYTALARFDRDVLGQPGVSTVILLEGINDIGTSPATNETPGNPVVTAEAMIQAMQQLIARCHLHHVKIVGGTITPYQGARYYADFGDKVREEVNQWIRTSGAFDAVIDFSKALEDPAHPGHLLPLYDYADHLHPGDAGHHAMAEAAAAVLQQMDARNNH